VRASGQQRTTLLPGLCLNLQHAGRTLPFTCPRKNSLTVEELFCPAPQNELMRGAVGRGGMAHLVSIRGQRVSNSQPGPLASLSSKPLAGIARNVGSPGMFQPEELGYGRLFSARFRTVGAFTELNALLSPFRRSGQRWLPSISLES
jgi:hypothetical protein